MLGAFIHDFVIDSSDPLSYIGKTFSLEGKMYRIGELIAVGEEKFVYQLLNSSGVAIAKVFKIYRGQADLAAELAKEAIRQDISEKLDPKKLGLKNVEIRTLLHELHQVQGGLAAIQEQVGGEAWHGLAEIRPDGTVVAGPVFSDKEVLPRPGELIPSETYSLLRNADYAAAYDVLSKYFEMNDANLLCLELLIICCLYIQRFDEGIALAKAGLAANPSWNRGQSLMTSLTGLPETMPEVKQRLSELLQMIDRVSPKSHGTASQGKYERVNSLVRSALADEQRGRFKKALKKYDAVLAEPIPFEASGVVYYNKANVLRALKREQDAEDAYLRSVASPLPAHIFFGVLNNLSLLLSSDLGRLHETLACVEMAIQHEPKASFLWARRAEVLYHLNRYVEAIDAAEQALQLDPSMQAVAGVVARAAHSAARMEQLLTTSIKKINDNPQMVEGWHDIMIALLNLGRVDEALSVADQAIKGHSDWHQIHAMRAAAWLARSNWDEAVRESNRALAIASDDNEAQYFKQVALRVQVLQKKLNAQQSQQNKS